MAGMVDRSGFLYMAVVRLPLGLYALLNPRSAKKQNADGPYFKSGFADLPPWSFRAGGIVTLGLAAFFASMFWMHWNSN
jgi:hypothetical protein